MPFLDDQATPEPEILELRRKVNELQPLAEEYRLIIENVRDYALIRFDLGGRVVGWGAGAARLLGYPEGEVLGQAGALFFTPEDIRLSEPEREMEEAERGGQVETERWHIRREGSYFWGSDVMTAMRDPDGKLHGYFKIVRDLTARREVDEKLRESEDKLRRFIENVTDYALVQVSPENTITSWNPGAERIFGYTEEEILGQDVAVLFVPEDRAVNLPARDLEKAVEHGRAEDERWMVRQDGSRFISRWVTTPIRGGEGQLLGYAKVLRDETARRAWEERLQSSLLERETLLKEIHHRVKNNLQVIVSLLRLQANRISDPAANAMFQDTQSRVRAIAGIHETLYSSPDLANIEFSVYARRLVSELFSFYDISPERVEAEIDAADLVLDITQAIPLGLILNEVVVNSLRHAFPKDRKGKLKVSLSYLDERVLPGETLDQGRGQLVISDNGVGLPPGFDFAQASSMGMYLVRLLGRQLHGSVEVTQPGGTCFAITFPLTLDSEETAL